MKLLALLPFVCLLLAFSGCAPRAESARKVTRQTDDGKRGAACDFCGERDWKMDLNGSARVLVCQSCEVSVPIGIWEERHGAVK